ncbi:MAG: alpha-amylase, partial [Pseudomonadota bacterium]
MQITAKRSLKAKVSSLVRQIYPELDASELSDQILAAFWPEGSQRRKRGRPPSNNLWSEKDALVITYG